MGGASSCVGARFESKSDEDEVLASLYPKFDDQWNLDEGHDGTDVTNTSFVAASNTT